MDTDDGTPTGADHAGLAPLELELALLLGAVVKLKTALADLLAALELQIALERRAPQEGDQSVRWN